ncbi:MAG: ABC transporter ATP-binding protein, partial [Thermaurantiacus tibetensis]
QPTEVLVVHRGAGRQAARAEAREMLEVLQIPEPDYRLGQYPHELSGGMRQRIMIAMALLCRPSLLVADEPTTALDTTVQAAILRSFAKLKQHAGTALILVSHDLGVVAGLADRVAVMYAGRIVEMAPAERLFAAPRHPYTQGLLASTPRLDRAPSAPLPAIDGQPPDPASVPEEACAFRPRCKVARPACAAGRPPPVEVAPGHRVACLAAEPA